jgi:hypothetical protein
LGGAESPQVQQSDARMAKLDDSELDYQFYEHVARGVQEKQAVQ